MAKSRARRRRADHRLTNTRRLAARAPPPTIAIDIRAGAEKSVAATKTFVTSAVAGLAILGAWTGDTALLAALRRLPAHFAQGDRLRLDGARRRAAEDDNSLFILGRGPSAAIANEAALKFKETCGMHAEAYSAAEVMHGPLALVRHGLPGAGARRPRRARKPSMAETADALADKGAAVFVTSLRAGKARMLPLAATGHPLTDPLALIVSFYAFVEAFARQRGLNPDEPRQSAQSDGDAMSGRFAITGARIFDGDTWHDDAALLVSGGQVEGIVAAARVPKPASTSSRPTAACSSPGFVDLQVNGGGGRDAQRPAGRRDDPHDLRAPMRRSARPRCCRR